MHCPLSVRRLPLSVPSRPVSSRPVGRRRHRSRRPLSVLLAARCLGVSHVEAIELRKITPQALAKQLQDA